MEAAMKRAQPAWCKRTVRGHPVPEGRLVPVGDTHIWVREVPGDGDPIVLLHGLGATAALNYFGAFAPLATLGHHVIAPDIPGHGRSPCGRRFSLTQSSRQVGALLDALSVERATVVGYSMGGAIAQLLARDQPELVSGLVLCATSRDFRGSPADRLRFAAAGVLAVGTRAVPMSAFPFVGAIASGRPGERWWVAREMSRSSPAALFQAADALGRFTSRTWVRDLDVPAAVVLTTRDRLVSPSRQAKLAAALRHARVMPIDGDHFVAGRAPEAFAGLLVAAAQATGAGNAAAVAA
jgi:3-oxoadipate enol-lactonase